MLGILQMALREAAFFRERTNFKLELENIPKDNQLVTQIHKQSIYIKYRLQYQIFFSNLFFQKTHLHREKLGKWEAGSFSATATLVIYVSKNVRCVTDDDTDFPLKWIGWQVSVWGSMSSEQQLGKWSLYSNDVSFLDMFVNSSIALSI